MTCWDFPWDGSARSPRADTVTSLPLRLSFDMVSCQFAASVSNPLSLSALHLYSWAHIERHPFSPCSLQQTQQSENRGRMMQTQLCQCWIVAFSGKSQQFCKCHVLCYCTLPESTLLIPNTPQDKSEVSQDVYQQRERKKKHVCHTNYVYSLLKCSTVFPL